LGGFSESFLKTLSKFKNFPVRVGQITSLAAPQGCGTDQRTSDYLNEFHTLAAPLHLKNFKFNSKEFIK